MMTRLTTTVSDNTLKQLSELKGRLGGTQSEIVRRAVLELWERQVEARKEGK